MAYVSAILDACVLYPAPIRDLLIRLSRRGLYHARWTTRIHEEWMGSLLTARSDLNRGTLERTRDLMDKSVADCLITLDMPIPDYELPDANDNHVLAAAVAAGATFIITYNLKDFPLAITKPLGVVAIHPDTFVLTLISENRASVVAAARCQRVSLKNPPKTVEEYLETLSKSDLKSTVSELRKTRESL